MALILLRLVVQGLSLNGLRHRPAVEGVEQDVCYKSVAIMAMMMISMGTLMNVELILHCIGTMTLLESWVVDSVADDDDL